MSTAGSNTSTKRSDNRIYTVVKILGTKYRALLDTGSTCSCINSEIYQRCVESGSVESSTKRNIIMANGTKLITTKAVFIKLELNDEIFKHKLIVMPTLPHVLVGIDLLRKAGIRLEWPWKGKIMTRIFHNKVSNVSKRECSDQSIQQKTQNMEVLQQVIKPKTNLPTHYDANQLKQQIHESTCRSQYANNDIYPGQSTLISNVIPQPPQNMYLTHQDMSPPLCTCIRPQLDLNPDVQVTKTSHLMQLPPQNINALQWSTHASQSSIINRNTNLVQQSTFMKPIQQPKQNMYQIQQDMIPSSSACILPLLDIDFSKPIQQPRQTMNLIHQNMNTSSPACIHPLLEIGMKPTHLNNINHNVTQQTSDAANSTGIFQNSIENMKSTTSMTITKSHDTAPFNEFDNNIKQTPLSGNNREQEIIKKRADFNQTVAKWMAEKEKPKKRKKKTRRTGLKRYKGSRLPDGTRRPSYKKKRPAKASSADCTKELEPEVKASNAVHNIALKSVDITPNADRKIEIEPQLETANAGLNIELESEVEDGDYSRSDDNVTSTESESNNVEALYDNETHNILASNDLHDSNLNSDKLQNPTQKETLNDNETHNSLSSNGIQDSNLNTEKLQNPTQVIILNDISQSTCSILNNNLTGLEITKDIVDNDVNADKLENQTHEIIVNDISRNTCSNQNNSPTVDNLENKEENVQKKRKRRYRSGRKRLGGQKLPDGTRMPQYKKPTCPEERERLQKMWIEFRIKKNNILLNMENKGELKTNITLLNDDITTELQSNAAPLGDSSISGVQTNRTPRNDEYSTEVTSKTISINDNSNSEFQTNRSPLNDGSFTDLPSNTMQPNDGSNTILQPNKAPQDIGSITDYQSNRMSLNDGSNTYALVTAHNESNTGLQSNPNKTYSQISMSESNNAFAPNEIKGTNNSNEECKPNMVINSGSQVPSSYEIYILSDSENSDCLMVLDSECDKILLADDKHSSLMSPDYYIKEEQDMNESDGDVSEIKTEMDVDDTGEDNSHIETQIKHDIDINNSQILLDTGIKKEHVDVNADLDNNIVMHSEVKPEMDLNEMCDDKSGLIPLVQEMNADGICNKNNAIEPLSVVKKEKDTNEMDDNNGQILQRSGIKQESTNEIVYNNEFTLLSEIKREDVSEVNENNGQISPTSDIKRKQDFVVNNYTPLQWRMTPYSENKTEPE